MSKATGIGVPRNETTRKALRDYVNSQEGAQFTLETAKRCAQVTKRVFFSCSNCKVRNEVEIDDSRGSIAALAFMHEFSVGKPERELETVNTTKGLADMSEREREALRIQVYAKLGQVLESTRELVGKARDGDQEAIDACLALLDSTPVGDLPAR